MKIGNETFVLPRFQLNHFYIANYKSERWLLELIKDINKKRPINTFIDVGVNIGQTLLKMKAVDANIQYYGFEPNPFCCSVVKQIILDNNIKHSYIIPCGLGDSNRLHKLGLPEKSNLTDSTASMIENFRRGEIKHNQFVTVYKLDDVKEDLEIENIDMIKIDIEGAELEAVAGMIETLKKYKPIIIIEVLPSYDASNDFRILRQKRLYSLLDGVGYDLYQAKNKDTDVIFEWVKGFPVHGQLEESDYILLPKGINMRDLGLVEK